MARADELHWAHTSTPHILGSNERDSDSDRDSDSNSTNEEQQYNRM
jgi:hypothetical protein